METRALTRRPGAARVWDVAALLGALLAALLGAWFYAGWHDVRLRQREVRRAPYAAANQRATELARDLHAALETLLVREVRRPHVHARASDEPLVRGYFQIDAQGRATTPALGDDAPDRADTDTEHLAEQRAFLGDVMRDLVRELTPVSVAPLEWRTLRFAGAPTLVAVRTVQTPDGVLAQGFVVDRSALTTMLAAQAGELVATLHASAEARGHAVAPGWQLTVAPNPRTLAAAAVAAHEVARAFVIRFVLIGAIALVAAALVLVLALRATRLARERSQLAAAAAHELQTAPAGPQMSEEAARLGHVVSNALGFTQLERGDLAIDAQLGPLGDVLRELAERAEPALDRAGAALDLDIAPELCARFDRDALLRILGNLLDNAEKYARGAANRTIRLAARDRGDVVEVIVQDHGPGIADCTALFRRLSRRVTADGSAGLGLGLAVSRSLAQAMGGELAYRASDARGATFVLTLPRA